MRPRRRAAWVWRQRDYAEPACPRVWTLNDVSLAPTRKVYRLIRAISPSGVLASTFSRVSLRCRLAWKSESVVMLRAVASCSESKPKHQSSRLSFRATGNRDRKSTRLNSSHANISYAVFCLKKKKIKGRKNVTYRSFED